MGYCLGRDNSFQKALFLLGNPGSGKGTILRLLAKLVGEQNTSAVALDDLKQKTSVSNLLNKLVNIDADVSVNAKDFEADFRKISGKDAITAKILFKDEFRFKPYCKLIIAGQELPRISDKTRGFYRRMLIINFNVTFENREDKGLDDKLELELSGILNWALEGRKRLYENGNFTTTQIMVEYIEDLKLENNPVQSFIKECIGFHDGAKISKAELYKYYHEQSVLNGNTPLSKINFGKEFYRIVGTLTKKDYRDYSIPEKTPIWINVYIRGKNEPVLYKPTEEIDWSENGKTNL
jgi:P4 family phage/plasmid primase-like protien